MNPIATLTSCESVNPINGYSQYHWVPCNSNPLIYYATAGPNKIRLSAKKKKSNISSQAVAGEFHTPYVWMNLTQNSISVLNKFRRSTISKALKLWKGRSSGNPIVKSNFAQNLARKQKKRHEFLVHSIASWNASVMYTLWRLLWLTSRCGTQYLSYSTIIYAY